MKLGDVYRWNNVFPDSESELAILIAKREKEGFYWAYQFFFPIRGVKYWFRDTELHYAQLITKEAPCQSI